ncbi:MAG: Uma2 family endonuclease [Oscillospiraceae bacterium]|nr:Uma2 family endonuclease [Oscillospiraceae bacterium]
MALPQEKSYTWADLRSWDGPERYELIDGVPRLLAAPATVHQRISGRLYRQLANYLDGKKCEAFYAPFDVRLFEQDGDCPEDIDVVLQPDLMVVCDPKKIDAAGCKGAPDFVIEVLSQSSMRHDLLTKRNLYQQAGVREYWTVDPIYQVIQVNILQNGQYTLKTIAGAGDQLAVEALPGCVIDLSAVFPEPDLSINS